MHKRQNGAPFTPFVHRVLFASMLAGLLIALPSGRLRALVISEIMYHASAPVDAPFEFLELYNENPDPFDLSGYIVCNGVFLEFPPGTWMDGKTFLVACSDLQAFQDTYGTDIDAIEWASGNLDNGGERVEICNSAGRTVVDVRYNDRGKWPVGADGTGHTLTLRSPFLDVDDPDSWRLSEEFGGTPGEPNGPFFESGAGFASGSGIDGAGFILRWLMLGPYTGANCNLGPSGPATLEADWLRESLGGAVQTDLIWEDGVQINTNYALAQSDGLHPNAGAGAPTLRDYASPGDTINLNDAVYPPDPNNVMAYSFVYVDNVTDAPLLVDVAVHSDDAINVMVNGDHVLTVDACRGVGNPGEIADRAPAVLDVGKNLIVAKVFENGGGWSFRLRLERRGTGQPLASKSAIQITTDPNEGLFFGGGGTPIEPPGEDPPPPEPGIEPGDAPVVINEGLLRTAGTRWIELYNRTAAPIDLAGYHVTDDASDLTKAQLAAGTVLPAGGHLSFTETQLGLDFSVQPLSPRVFVALVEPAGDKVVDAYNFEPQIDEKSEARIPDGDDEFDDGAEPTRGAANDISVSSAIVINEIMYHPIDDDLGKEYVELYNRSAAGVDIGGWSFTNGINFVFPAGTIVQADGYLVVARSPDVLRALHGLGPSEVVGPEQTPEALASFGQLRNAGERLTLSDTLLRTVDTVNFTDGGEWARWPDGLGSSLELIDANQDNRFGQAWDASDDSDKAVTQEFSYIGRHGGGESELHFLLNDRGIAIIDDISVIGGGISTQDTPLIEAGETWRYFKGTQEPPANWNTQGFSDGSWLSGPTGIGYGDGDDATELTDMIGSYLTVFCRKTFNVSNPAAIDELVLSVAVDDGFYAYLNGTEVASYNAGGKAFDDPAAGTVGDSDLVVRDISSFKNRLQAGTNVLAIQVHNTGLTSSDLSCVPRLLDRTTTVGGGSELITNGTFNSNESGWIIQGTHVWSGRTNQDTITGAGSLKLIASGRGDNKANRIETPNGGTGLNGQFVTGEDMAISFKARWVVGSQSLVTHGYEHAMAQSHQLLVPENLGTPGRLNSVTQRWIDLTGASNLGPVISDVAQDLAVPGDGESVTVTARVVDPDGVSSVQLRYSINNPSAGPAVRNMTQVGTDLYRATIPGQGLGDKVVFHIIALDSGSRAGRFPVDVTTHTHPLLINPVVASLDDHRYCVYRHDVKDPATSYHSYRFVMTDTNEQFLTNRARLSNDLVHGSFLYAGHSLYYESFTRFSGSPFARGSWGGSFRVTMPKDNPLHGRIERFNLDNRHGSGNDARERISHYLLRQHNTGATVVPYSEPFTMVRWQVNGRSIGNREHVENPSSNFNEFWFPDDDEGDFKEMDDRFVIGDDGGSRLGNTNGRVLYPPPSSRSDGNGENQENYRWFFGNRGPRAGMDDYSDFINFARIMDPGVTSDGNFASQIWDVCNVEQFLRIWSVRLNTDDWDQWGANRGKNCYFYRPDLDGRYHLYAWDMELTYGGTGSFLIPDNPSSNYSPGGFGEVHRLFRNPKAKRMWYAILSEMVSAPDPWFDSDFLDPYMRKLAAIGMSRTEIGTPGGFIDTRADLLRTRIAAAIYPQVRLRITTNGGNDFSTDGVTVDLAGTAPAEACDLIVDGERYDLNFSSMSNWTLRGVSLLPGANALSVVGIDLKGNVVDADSITVTSTAGPFDPPVIGELSPDSALASSTVEIIGSAFLNGVRVFFDTVESPNVDYDAGGPNPDSILAEVPPGSGSVLVTVRNPDGQTSNGLEFTYMIPPPQFLRGDGNNDAVVDISDGLTILNHITAARLGDCEDALDANDDELLNTTDAVYLLNYLFLNGSQIPAPFPVAGPDPGGETLGCDR